MAHIALNGFGFDIEQSASGVTPQAAYATWATELGVPATGTLQPLDADDTAWPVALAAPVVYGGVDFVFSSEGAIGISNIPLQGRSQTPRTLPGVSRMYDIDPGSGLLFTFHPQVDCRSEDVKVQRAGIVTILNGRIRHYSAGVPHVEFSARLEPGKLQLILAPVDQPVAFNIFGRNNGIAILPVDTNPGDVLQVDITDLHYEEPVYQVYLSLAQIIGQGAATSYGAASLSTTSYLSVEEGLVKDLNTGVLGKGIGRVYGTVQRKTDPANTPLKRRVRLMRERDGLVVREAWSDAVTGAYDFRYIDELQQWTVIAYDHEHNFRAVIADGITPEIIP